MSEYTGSGLSSIISEGVQWIPPEEAISDRQVLIAIKVLRAYADGTLRTDLCDEFDEVLSDALDAYLEYQCGDDYVDI